MSAVFPANEPCQPDQAVTVFRQREIFLALLEMAGIRRQQQFPALIVDKQPLAVGRRAKALEAGIVIKSRSHVASGTNGKSSSGRVAKAMSVEKWSENENVAENGRFGNRFGPAEAGPNLARAAFRVTGMPAVGWDVI